MQPGLIYSRINDSNTPVDESTSDKQMELLTIMGEKISP